MLHKVSTAWQRANHRVTDGVVSDCQVRPVLMVHVAVVICWSGMFWELDSSWLVHKLC